VSQVVAPVGMPGGLDVSEGLETRRILVWSAPLDCDAPLTREVAECLSADERARAERFVFPRDRNRFLTGRAFLRLLLAGHTGKRAAALRFRYGPHGKPALAGKGPAFNLAHSDGLAVCALAPAGEIGVDVERVRPVADADSVAGSFFSSRETADLAALPHSQRLRGFFDAWTRKEAFLKALGSGLARPLDSFDVTLAPAEPPRLRRTAGDPGEAARYSLHALEPEPGYVAAVAIEGHGWQVRHRRWSWIERGTREEGA
jgi:4'-phosphopantetheinyl transferase